MRATVARWLSGDATPTDERALTSINRAFMALSTPRRVERALEILPGLHVLASSFGAQAAVMLHLVTQVEPGIPIVLIDTGYLFRRPTASLTS